MQRTSKKIKICNSDEPLFQRLAGTVWYRRPTFSPNPNIIKTEALWTNNGTMPVEAQNTEFHSVLKLL